MTSARTTADSPTAGVVPPRPQLRRALWHDLSGVWDFAYDDDDHGRRSRWFETGVTERTLVVPFPPESPASSIGDTGLHPVLWYSRTMTTADLTRAGLGSQGDRAVLHFGAVDYAAMVWLDGKLLGTHQGGHTPFAFDISDHLGAEEHLLVVRAVDRADDVGQPRGKQGWELEPRDIWYSRTSGIWQAVWLEAVPALHITDLTWTTSPESDVVTLELQLSEPPPPRPVSRSR